MPKKIKEKNKNKTMRPPVVVVLGHVDHGKTTLLDAIRKTDVAKGESGGITQHIGAYQIEFKDKKITFIDTPGHEAFSQMRSRGAKVADIAILVIAAEEGIKPQTKEVISYIKELKIPTIVAINKIDKPSANLEKVLSELAAEGITVESRGGEVLSVNVAAINGQGIDDILEAILLITEMEELKENSTETASGVIIEAHLDPQRGPIASLLVREGILKKGDIIVSGNSYGKAKNLEDSNGKTVTEATASMPVAMLGFNKVPLVGEKFEIVSSEEIAIKKAEDFRPPIIEEEPVEEEPKQEEQESEEGEGEGKKVEKKEVKTLNLILKADVQGSLEAIQEILDKIKQENVKINIIKSEVGDISEFDIKLAFSTKAIIIGFGVKSSDFIFNLAKREKVRLKIFSIIYELAEEVKKGMLGLLDPELKRVDLGELEILEIFRKEKSKMIIGGKVLSGKIENKTVVDVIRPGRGKATEEEEKIGTGKIMHLQHNKKDVPEVEKGKEAGILLEGPPVAEIGDILRAYKEEKNQREL